MKKFWKAVLAVVLYTVIAQVVHSLGAMFSMKYYLMEEYFPVWSKIMMPNAGPPPASFMFWSLGLGLLVAIALVVVYCLIKKGLPGKSSVHKGLWYALVLFLIAGLPAMFMTFLIINLPLGLLAMWVVEAAVIYVLGGMVIASLVK